MPGRFVVFNDFVEDRVRTRWITAITVLTLFVIVAFSLVSDTPTFSTYVTVAVNHRGAPQQQSLLPLCTLPK